MSVAAIWLLAYLVLVFLLLVKYLGKTSVSMYCLNRRRTGTAMLVATSLATTIGGGVLVGLIAIGYEAGIVGFFIGLAYAIGLIIMGYFAPRIYKYSTENNILSFPNFLNHRYYGEKRGAFNYLVTLVNMFVFFFLLAAQFVAMAVLIKHVFGLHYSYALVVSALVVVAYTTMAGLSGVFVTDAIQFVFIVIITFTLFLPRALSLGAGNWGALPRAHMIGTGYGVVFFVGLLFFIPATIVRMEIWQRVLAAKTPSVARRTCLITGLCLLPFYAVFPLIGMAVRAVGTELAKPDGAAYSFIGANFQGHLEGLIFVGILAALMSSADSFLNLLAISAVKDLGIGGGQRLWSLATSSKESQEREQVNATLVRRLRLATLVLGLAGVVVAVIVPNLVDLMVVGTSSVVIFTPATLAVLVKKKAARVTSAVWSVVAGFVANLLIFGSASAGLINFEAKASYVPALFIATIVFFVTEGICKLRGR